MKRTRFSEEQIIGVLKEAEAGAKTADLARRHGVSEATIYNWKAKYGGLEVSEARRLRELESENAKLKRLLADAMLDQAGAEGSSGKKVLTPAAKREAVAHLQACHGMSERRACRVIDADRKSVRYRSIRDDDASAAREAARAGQPAAPVRLSPFAYPAAPGGRDDQPQEDPAAVSGGRSGGEAATQPQACCRDQSACSGAGPAEPALEPGLRS